MPPGRSSGFGFFRLNGAALVARFTAISSPVDVLPMVPPEWSGAAFGMVYFQYGRECKNPCIHRGLRVLEAPPLPA